MKIGIVGIGDVAVNNYIPFLKEQEEVQLGLYNRTPAKAEAAARQFGQECFSTVQAMVDWKPDAVFVLTNETTRYEIATELIDLGVKRMLCEKPLVAKQGQAHVTEEDFQKGKTLLKLATEKSCEMAMMFNYRFFDQTLAAKKIAASRNFGAAINVVGQVHYACWSHCIDLIQHFAGDLVEISALAGKSKREGQGIVAEDVAAAFRTENGATGTLLGTSGMKWQHPLFELGFTFEQGRIHLRDIDGDMEVLDGANQTHERISMVRNSSRWDHYGASFKKALSAYLEATKRGDQPPVTGWDGLRELQVEASLRRSISQGRPVLVKEEFPLR